VRDTLKISASIVVYQEDPKTLRKVIEDYLSLQYTLELIIVDNSPSPKLQSLCQNYSHLTYLFTGTNLGFGKGHNLAFSTNATNSQIHLILNPDISFDKQEMEGFLEWFAQDTDTSLALPQILNPDLSIQNVVRNIPTPLSLLKRKLKIPNNEPKIEKNSIIEIPFAHGCFMAFKTEVFEKLHGFDERFFMYMEDVDIFIRAKEYGKTVINTHYSLSHEHRQASAKSFSLFRAHLVSAIKFFWKYR
jgi:GT2 family glycosyltransferase